jgi:hypothetical protein
MTQPHQRSIARYAHLERSAKVHCWWQAWEQLVDEQRSMDIDYCSCKRGYGDNPPEGCDSCYAAEWLKEYQEFIDDLSDQVLSSIESRTPMPLPPANYHTWPYAVSDPHSNCFTSWLEYMDIKLMELLLMDAKIQEVIYNQFGLDFINQQSKQEGTTE